MRSRATLLLAAVGLAVAGRPAAAQTSGSWAVDAAGNWGTAGNWLGNVVPDGGGTATFGFPLTAPRTVTLEAPRLVGGVVFANTSSNFGYTLGGAGPLTFTDGSTLTYGTAGVNAISAPVALNGNLTLNGTPYNTQILSGAISDGSGPGRLTVATTLPGVGFYPLSGVQLSVANSFTGGVTLQSGVLRLLTASSFGGTVTAAGGALQTGGTTGVVLPNAVDVTAADLILTSTGGVGLTLSGVVGATGGSFGVRSRVQGISPVTLTNANTYTGPTISELIPVDTANTPTNAGPVVFSGGGTALASSGFFASAGGVIRFDNSANTTLVQRTATTAPVGLTGGVVQTIGGTAAGPGGTQQLGQLTGTGYNVVSGLSAALGTGEGVTTDFSSLGRGATGTGTFLFFGSGAVPANTATAGTVTGTLGGPAGTNVQRFTFATAPAQVGGVIPFAVGGQTTTYSATAVATPSPGEGLVTYDANGVRLLTAGEYTASLAAGGNVQLTAPAANAATQTVNSLFLTGTGAVSGTGTLNVTSGLVANTVATTVTNNLSFGSAQVNFFTLGAAATVTGRVSGTGGLVKSGGSTQAGTGNSALTLSPYNTYTGTTAVNDGTIFLTDPSALGRDTSAIQLSARSGGGGSGLRVGPGLLGGAVVLPRDLVTNSGYASLAANTAVGNRQVLVAAGNLSGAGGLLIAGVSTNAGRSLTLLAGTNTHQGQTRLFSGDLGFASDANLGAASSVFDFGTATGAGVLQFGNWATTRTVNVSSNALWDTNGFNATLGGFLTGTGTNRVTKAGAGTATFDSIGASVYPGGLRVAGGGYVLTGNTQFPASPITLISGSVRFDNAASPVSNRVGTQNAVTFENGGVGTLQIDAGANIVAQTLSGAIGLSIGPGGTGSGRLVLTASSGSVRVNATGAAGYGVAGNNSPSFVLQGDGLAGTGAGTTALLFSTAPSEANGQLAGTGAAGTPTVGVLRGGFGITTSGGSRVAIGLITQTSPTEGARLLADAEYAPDFSTANANVRLSGATTTGAATVNSLSLVGGAATVTTGTTLTVRGGSILATGGASSITGSGTDGGGATLASLAFNAVNSGFPVYVDEASTLTLNATLTGGGAGSRLVKIGPGTLVFDPRDGAGNPVTAFTAFGDTRVFDGTFVMPTGAAGLTNLPGNLFLAGGATFRYGGAGVATGRTISLNGEGGTLDLAGTLLQLTGTGDTLTRVAAGNYGVGRLAAGTLVLGSGTSGTPVAVQPSTVEGGFFLNGGTLVLNATGTLGAAGPLGTGTLRLNGGVLAPLYATRDVGVPVEVPLGQNPTFSNNLNLSGGLTALTADTSNAGLNFLAPVRLMGSSTFTSNLSGGGAVTFSGSIYDSPYAAPATLTLAGTPAGPFNLNGPAVHRGGTLVSANALVSAGNLVGSATGSGPVTVQAGGTLRSAAGTTAGFVVPAPGGTVTVNGILAPGQGVGANGILTVGAPDRTVAVTLSGASSRYQFELTATNAGSVAALNDGSSTTAVGAGNNYLRVRSDGTAGSSLAFSPTTVGVVSTAGLSNFDNTLHYSWQVADLADGSLTAGAPAFDTSAFNNATGGGTFNLSVVGQNLFLNFTPVPEPATVLAVAGLGLAAAGRLRRR